MSELDKAILAYRADPDNQALGDRVMRLQAELVRRMYQRDAIEYQERTR